MRAFIRENREELDRLIKPHVVGTLNDEDREGWIYNDEGLYEWAKAEGVRV
jgi:hypothetical protein